MRTFASHAAASSMSACSARMAGLVPVNSPETSIMPGLPRPHCHGTEQSISTVGRDQADANGHNSTRLRTLTVCCFEQIGSLDLCDIAADLDEERWSGGFNQRLALLLC